MTSELLKAMPAAPKGWEWKPISGGRACRCLSVQYPLALVAVGWRSIEIQNGGQSLVRVVDSKDALRIAGRVREACQFMDLPGWGGYPEGWTADELGEELIQRELIIFDERTQETRDPREVLGEIMGG